MKAKSALYVLLQCTWGLPQTLVGLVVYLICRARGCERFFFGGAVCTEWHRNDGVSLGLFIFCPPGGGIHLHEYGHTFQSLFLGPLYLMLVSLPSLVWAGLPAFRRMRRVRRVPYSRLWCEGWADRLGSKYEKVGRTIRRRPPDITER